jgi:RHS repeat-associated protein
VIQNDLWAHPTALNKICARAVDGDKNDIEWYHKNYLDHVYAVSDDSGNIDEHYRYTAFGEVEIYSPTGVKLAVSAIDNTVMWNSRRFDQDTNLYYYKWRHYKADYGRWPSRDPLADDVFLEAYFKRKHSNPNTIAAVLFKEKLYKETYKNLYTFAGNEPVRRYDVHGLLEHYQLKLKKGEKLLWLTHRTVNADGSILRLSELKAFSGEGANRNDPACCNVKDLGPLPPGKYYIVDRPSGGRLGGIKDWVSGKDEWFALYKDDGTVGDKTTHGGVVRENIRLHPGSTSHGCVTLSEAHFSKLRKTLLDTKTEVIPKTKIKYYGTITVLE